MNTPVLLFLKSQRKRKTNCRGIFATVITGPRQFFIATCKMRKKEKELGLPRRVLESTQRIGVLAKISLFVLAKTN